MKMKFKIAVVSDVGLVRKNNEDNFFVPKLNIKPMQSSCYDDYTEFVSDKAYICVCDGMGGHSSGEVASYMAAKETEKHYMDITDGTVKTRKKMEAVIQDFVGDTNDRIYNQTEHDGKLRAMGTTMTGLYFMNNKAYFVNVGDSRSYELRKTKINQLSIDHADPTSKNAITRFLGMSSEYGRLDADVAFFPSKIGTGCRYLLCSDGLTDMLDDKSIAGIVLSEKDVKVAAQALVDAAKKNGGRDNVTVIVIDVCPAGRLAKAVHNKIAVGCVTAALVLGAAGTAAYMLKPVPEVGANLSELTTEIEDAMNLKDALKGADNMIAEIDKTIKIYNDYASTVDETDDTVRAANAELKASAAQLQISRDTLASRIEEIKNSNHTDNDKMNLIKNISTDSAYIATDVAQSDCAAKKAAVDSSLAAWKDYLRQEEERKRQEEKAAAAAAAAQKKEKAKEKDENGKPNNSGNSGSNKKSGGSSGGNKQSGGSSGGSSGSYKQSGGSSGGNKQSGGSDSVYTGRNEYGYNSDNSSSGYEYGKYAK